MIMRTTQNIVLVTLPDSRSDPISLDIYKILIDNTADYDIFIRPLIGMINFNTLDLIILISSKEQQTNCTGKLIG